MSQFILPVFGYCINENCNNYNKKVKGVRHTDNKLNVFCDICDNKLYMFKNTKIKKNKN